MVNLRKAVDRYLKRRNGATTIGMREAFRELQKEIHHTLSIKEIDRETLDALLAASLDGETVAALFEIKQSDDDDDDEYYSMD